MKLHWTEPALHDLEKIGDYIAQVNPPAAARIVDAVFTRADRLVDFPNSGRPGRVKGTRELVVTKTPLVVPYRLVADRVELLAVLHGARRWPKTFD